MPSGGDHVIEIEPGGDRFVDDGIEGAMQNCALGVVGGKSDGDLRVIFEISGQFVPACSFEAAVNKACRSSSVIGLSVISLSAERASSSAPGGTFQDLRQALTCARQSRHHGSDRDRQDFGDLGVTKVFDRYQQQHATLLFRKGILSITARGP